MPNSFVYQYDYRNSWWSVGFYDPSGKWVTESEHDNKDDAAAHVHWLNGGERQRAEVVPMPKDVRRIKSEHFAAEIPGAQS